MSVDISKTHSGISTHLSVSGALSDSDAVAALELQFDTCIEQYQTNIVLDMIRVPLINSEALEVLLETQERLQRIGGDFLIKNLNNALKNVFIMTGIAQAIRCQDTELAEVEIPRSKYSCVGKKMGELLVERGLVAPEDIESAVQKQSSTGKKIGDILLQQNLISDMDLASVLAEQHDIPLIQIRTGLYDPEVVALLDINTAQNLMVLPLFRVRTELFLATANPQAINTFDVVSRQTRLTVRPILATLSNIEDITNNVQGADTSLESFIGELDIESDLEVIEGQIEQDLDAIDEQAAASPVISLINNLVQRAVFDGASDIHIEPGRGKARIRYRIDGMLYQIMTPPAELYPALVSRLKVMAKLDIAERRLPQDGRIQIITQKRVVDLRLSTLPGINGEKLVLRVLDKEKSILQLDNLGLNTANLKTFGSLLKRNHGLFLVTGPTGSGKTTTLYSAINHLNSIEKSIVTIEDPVEYQLDIINQNQVKEGIGLDFAKLFRHVLRQDPDVVMVGEIRDKETAEIAVQAALTGHLVLSTLHTNDAIGAITRLLDMGIQPFLLSSALVGVMAQRLIRKVCSNCKTTYTVPAEFMQEHGLDLSDKQTLVKGKGCAQCYDSGYKGRVAIHEILEVDVSTQQLMISNPSKSELDEHIKAKEMHTLMDSALENVVSGTTSIEEALRITH